MLPGRAADHSPPSSAAVMVKYLYPPSGPHRACNRITLPLPQEYGTRVLTVPSQILVKDDRKHSFIKQKIYITCN